MELSADASQSLSKHLERHTNEWLTQDQHAQTNRHADPSLMDIYDMAKAKGIHINMIQQALYLLIHAAPSAPQIQQDLIIEEAGDPLAHIQTPWIVLGIKIQELQYVLLSTHWIKAHIICRLALQYDLHIHGAKHTLEESLAIHNQQGHLQKLIDKFEHQANTFILHQCITDIPQLSSIDDYIQYENADLPDGPPNLDPQQMGHSTYQSVQRALNGSGMDLPIPLPSSVGWDWCSIHQAKSLTVKEAQLHVAHANESIHTIHFALGFKSAIFYTQVRSANSQQKKTCAWNAVKSVETTVHQNAHIYSMAHNAYWMLQKSLPNGLDLPQILPEDLHVAILVLGSDKAGQHNKQ
jgi:hypothetical protein